MNDEHEILVHKSKNVESARQIRFNNVSEVKSQQKILKEYILHAIEIEKSGSACNIIARTAMNCILFTKPPVLSVTQMQLH